MTQTDSKLVLITLLVKLGVAAAVSSSLVRSRVFKRLLLAGHRTPRDTMKLVAMIAVPFAFLVGYRGTMANIGVSLGKAGRKRWLGRKPHNRGVSMNPVSHPMGGGEGRTSGGRHPCSPTGVPAKGGPTRANKLASNKRIIRRRRGVRYGIRKLK